jgi:hypothetical protein
MIAGCGVNPVFESEDLISILSDFPIWKEEAVFTVSQIGKEAEFDQCEI